MDIFACPCDRELDIKQEEKANEYLDLAVEIKGLWKMKSVKVVPVAKRLENYLRTMQGQSWNHVKTQSSQDQQGSSKGSLKFTALTNPL